MGSNGADEAEARIELMGHLRNSLSLIEGAFRLREEGVIDDAQVQNRLRNDVSERIRRVRIQLCLAQLSSEVLECIEVFLLELEAWLQTLEQEAVGKLRAEYEGLLDLLEEPG